MKIKTEQMLWVAIAFIAMCGFILFVESGSVLTAVSLGFVFIIGSFLGVDLVKMIKDTSSLPDGKYQDIRKSRYILALIFFALLCIEAFIISKVYDRNLDGVYGSIGVGFMIVVSLFVSGIEANKIATTKG
ncbi:hypothetical protein [Sediminispirochaeta bajacaliforniensis]|uniref:hypothetical protein n=1 Tax=Sediminispirochaeta bajacaliforniensis TaxID=148 RepID=UPI00037A1480|nr:hypothetical protein [Sediminispirochaeta bajacaliforniensis]